MARPVDVAMDWPRRAGPDWVTLRLVAFCAASVALTVGAGLVQVTFGSYPLTAVEAWRALLDPSILFDPAVWGAFLLGWDLPEMTTANLVVWNIRLPRVLVGIVAGSSLAVSGSIFQGVTRNELASPFVLGVSSGAGFAVLVTLVLFSALAPLVPLLAAAGGALAFVLVYLVAWKGGTSPVRLVLAGVVVNMVFYSLQRALFFVADDLAVVQSALAWITGSLTGVGWAQVRLTALPAVAGLALALVTARQLNVLVLGKGTARSLGMRVERVRLLLAGIGILTASVAIVVAGVVSFFGLVVPHIVRNAVGRDYRQLVVGCLFGGPALLVTADVGARLAFSPHQLPVGVVTGIVGGPYFLYLMRTNESMGAL